MNSPQLILPSSLLINGPELVAGTNPDDGLSGLIYSLTPVIFECQ